MCLRVLQVRASQFFCVFHSFNRFVALRTASWVKLKYPLLACCFMLYLIGLGLADEKDITFKGLEAVKKCKMLYLESYTSRLSCSKEALEKFYGKKIQLANREFVENAEQLLKEAKAENVALLVIGDPLCATTHWDILQRAKEQKIKT